MPDVTPDNPQPLDPDDARTSVTKPGEGEVVYFEGSPALRGELATLLPWVFFAVVAFAAPFVLHYVFDRHLEWWVWLVCILAGFFLAMIPLLYIRSIRYRITNYTIDYERGVFSKAIDSMELWHVDDIKFHQNLIQRILGVGSVVVLSDDQTTPELTLSGLPSPRSIFEALKNRIIAVKRQRGVIKMDTGE